MVCPITQGDHNKGQTQKVMTSATGLLTLVNSCEQWFTNLRSGNGCTLCWCIEGDMQRFFTELIKSSFKLLTYCMQYKPVCVINFDKLRRKMLKSWSLVVFLWYSSAHRHAWRHIRMSLFLSVLLLRLDRRLFYQFFTTVISQRTTKMLRIQV